VTAAARIPFVRADGDPFECGYQHGAARAEALHAFIDDGLCRLNRILRTPVSMTSLRPMLDAYQAHIAAATPLLAEELRGLAQGADISAEQAVLLQLRREIMGYQRIPTMGDCTTYARSSGGHSVLAQTIDLNGDLEDHISVLDVGRTASSRRALVLTFGGLLGYLGVNSDGLAVGLNLVLGGEWRAGLPPYLAIRHLLDTAASVDEALQIVRSLRLASSRSLMLCDTEKAAYVEILGDEVRVVQAWETTHTNHFLHADFVSHDELNVFAKNFSVLRLDTCRQRLAGLPVEANVEDHLAVLSAPPIRVDGSGDIRRERTVAAVVMLPDRGEMHVRPGDPAQSRTQSFRLRP
jgi:isopenicillin-N N-acyltransferase-like protein